MAAVDLTACTVDVERGLVTRPDGGSARLTTRERELLAYFVERPGVVVSRTELLERVWKYHPETVTRVDIITMNRLRKKVERDAHAPDHFLTVHGEGYRFVPGVAASETPSSAPPPAWPAERDRWIGREQELDALAKLFADGARLVTLLGMGGAGKTRLAVRFGWTHRSGFPGEPWMIDLSHARDGEAVLAAAATTFGASDVGRAIAARGRCLVVVDNFEQVAAVAPGTLGTWLDKAPDARFLVTSREALRITGENVLAIGPLVEDDAKALFDERAAAAGSESGDDETVRVLVRMLDGIPLAIELAAARARTMSAAEMIERMGARFDLLTKSRGRSDRQATLRATLDWSWDLLSSEEKFALAQLSVFERSFTLAAAEAVVHSSADERRTAIADLVEALVDRSWLVPHGGRYAFLAMVHDYAAMRLAEGQDAWSTQEATRARHARYYAGLGIGFLARGGPYGIADPEDFENFAVTCGRAVTSGDLETLSATLWPAWNGLASAGAIPRAHRLVEQVRAMRGAELSPNVRFVFGQERLLADDYDGAYAEFRAAIDAADHEGNTVVAAAAWGALGEAYRARHDRVGARSAYVRSAALAQSMRAEGIEAGAILGLVRLANDGGDFAETLRLFDAKVAQDGGGVPLRRARLLLQLAWAHFALGDVDASRLVCARALDAAIEARDPVAEVDILAAQAITACTVGEHAAAEHVLRGGRMRSAGLGRIPWPLHWAAGEVAFATGDTDGARRHFAAAVASSWRSVHLTLELTLAERTLAPEDLGFVDERLSELDRLPTIERARLLFLLGVRCMTRNDPVAARGALADAEGILRRSQDLLHLWRVLRTRAQLDAMEGKRDDARAALDEVEAIARKMGARPESEIVGRLAAGRALLITGA